METKKCITCGRELPLDKFKKTRWGGYTNVCIECSTATLRKNKEDKAEALRTQRLQDFDANELMLELARRGYEGKLEYVQTRYIDIQKLLANEMKK